MTLTVTGVHDFNTFVVYVDGERMEARTVREVSTGVYEIELGEPLGKHKVYVVDDPYYDMKRDMVRQMARMEHSFLHIERPRWAIECDHWPIHFKWLAAKEHPSNPPRSAARRSQRPRHMIPGRPRNRAVISRGYFRNFRRMA